MEPFTSIFFPPRKSVPLPSGRSSASMFRIMACLGHCMSQSLLKKVYRCECRSRSRDFPLRISDCPPRSVPEVYADIEYTQEGSLISPLKCRVIQPSEVAERGTKPFLEGLSESQSRSSTLYSIECSYKLSPQLPVPAQNSSTPAQLPLKGRPYSICIHSDFAKATERLKE